MATSRAPERTLTIQQPSLKSKRDVIAKNLKISPNYLLIILRESLLIKIHFLFFSEEVNVEEPLKPKAHPVGDPFLP